VKVGSTSLILLVLALCATAIAGCGGGGSDSSTSTTALSTCNINGRQQNLGASYVTSIQVSGVSCAQAEKAVVAYHHCRLANGGAGGTCKSPVQGLTCTESARECVPGVPYKALVECRTGTTEIKRYNTPKS
jgi:hypothetical protein